ALKFLQPPAGYRWACDQRARRQGVIDQLLRDAVLHIQTDGQDRQRSDPQRKEEAPMQSKQKSEREVSFAKGGSTRMMMPQAAGPQKPGVTAHAVKDGAPGKRTAT